jgi:hypothetical protein
VTGLYDSGGVKAPVTSVLLAVEPTLAGFTGNELMFGPQHEINKDLRAIGDSSWPLGCRCERRVSSSDNISMSNHHRSANCYRREVKSSHTTTRVLKHPGLSREIVRFGAHWADNVESWGVVQFLTMDEPLL